MTLDDTIATLQESLIANGVPKETVAKVIRDLRKAQEQERASRPPAKRQKTQFAIIVSDPNGVLKGTDLVGWAVQMEEEAAPQTALDRVKAAGYAFNASKRGRTHPVASIGEIFQNVPRKYWSTGRETEKTVVKTREPVLVIRTDNVLPKTEAEVSAS